MGDGEGGCIDHSNGKGQDDRDRDSDEFVVHPNETYLISFYENVPCPCEFEETIACAGIHACVCMCMYTLYIHVCGVYMYEGIFTPCYVPAFVHPHMYLHVPGVGR